MAWRSQSTNFSPSDLQLFFVGGAIAIAEVGRSLNVADDLGRSPDSALGLAIAMGQHLE